MSEQGKKTSIELSERFEAAFNRIHTTLKRLHKRGDTDVFMELLHETARKHASVRKHLDELKQYAKLRNAIVHEKTETNYYIAQPHEDIVERIEAIDQILSEPAEAMSIATTPVYTLEPSTSLTKVLQMIKENGYSEYPVYERGICKGLITARGILCWMTEHHSNSKVDFSQTTVSDILPLETDHTIAFTDKKATVFDIEYTFEEHQNKNKKLEAILITQNGTSEELPSGIITTWDLTKINEERVD
ncbi:MAG TPA: CBS domain-containing protein [Chondromyces sp.]|nr:CBS domain-containing protein [Chondromyces sp.]